MVESKEEGNFLYELVKATSLVSNRSSGKPRAASGSLQLICGEPAGLSRRDKPGGSPNFLTFELQ
jgi:hypothetical protein